MNVLYDCVRNEAAYRKQYTTPRSAWLLPVFGTPFETLLRKTNDIMKVLITGTSSGIGEALAKEYLKRNHKVWGISRRRNDELLENENYMHLAQDITEFTYCALNTANFLAGAETLDLVALNAGTLNNIKYIRDTSVDELQETMKVNVWGNKTVLDAALNMCKIKQVVTISSGAAVNATQGWNAYAISKAALKMMTELYAAENEDTHFSSVAPGLVDTDMQEYLTGLNEEEKFPVIKKLKDARGTDKMPAPEEVAGKLIETFKKVAGEPSGSFVDIRKY